MITRNRSKSALFALDRLHELPERPPVIVVDNDSSDGTCEAIRRRHPSVVLIEAGRNFGAAGRNIGAELAETPYVAFSDDDSWWESGALARATKLLEAHRGLGLVAARILVGPDDRVDPACLLMAESPVRHRESDHPGTAVLGFLACGVVVRREAFLQVGGFCMRFGIGGEEELLSIDLANAEWGLAYVDDVVVHHYPAPRRDDDARRHSLTRNALWSAWLRLRVPAAVRRTAQLLRRSDGSAVGALTAAVFGLPWVLSHRRVVGASLEMSLVLLAAAKDASSRSTRASLRCAE